MIMEAAIPEFEPSRKRPNYKRSAATRDVNRFIGWDYINDLLSQTEFLLLKYEQIWKRYDDERERRTRLYRLEHPRSKRIIHPHGMGREPREVHATPYDVLEHQAFIIMLLKMGGRIGELIGTPTDDGEEWKTYPLRWDNISFIAEPGWVMVFEMGMNKHYRKVRSQIWTEKTVVAGRKVFPPPPSKKHLWHYHRKSGSFIRKVWITEPIPESRSFKFPIVEPLNDYLIGWVEQKEYEDKLEGGSGILFEKPYSHWYWFLSKLDVMREKHGSQVRWSHIYPHWFRAQRASQLKQDYEMDIDDIGNWGKWSTLEVVRKYVGTEKVVEDKMMAKAKKGWT